jgi:Flp pilus assembly pilin Flp
MFPVMTEASTIGNLVTGYEVMHHLEYTLLMAFVALASAAIFVSAGGSVNSIWASASNRLGNAATSAS